MKFSGNPKWFGSIMKSAVFFIFVVLSLPSNAIALSFTRYEISSWAAWSLHSEPLTGYAIVQNEPVISTIGSELSGFDIYYDFIVKEFAITFDSGLMHSGSGYVRIANTYLLMNDGWNVQAEDYWVLGDYTPGMSGFGMVSLDLAWTSHDLFTTPIGNLPESFGLTHYYYDDYYHEQNYDGQHCSSNGITFNNPAPVPEPSTLLFLSAGFAGIGFLRRRMGK